MEFEIQTDYRAQFSVTICASSLVTTGNHGCTAGAGGRLKCVMTPEKPSRCLVIGSGPSGMAAAVALTKRGEQVTVIDPGIDLETNLLTIKRRMGSTEPPEWSQQDIHTLTDATKASAEGADFKACYGSSFVYRAPESAGAFSMLNAKLYRSFAVGGLSWVWGASVLPYAASEFKRWPVSFEEMSAHYRAIVDFMPHSATDDAISQVLDFLPASGEELRMTPQMSAVMASLQKNQGTLGGKGITFGRSRLAVTNNPASGRGCRYCGLCMYGCPYDLIYNSQHTLHDLRSAGKIEYLPGHLAQEIREEGNSVIVSGSRIANSTQSANAESGSRNEQFNLVFDRVFIAAGVLETGRLMLRSLNRLDSPITLKHSDIFILPMMRFKRSKGCMNAPNEQKGHQMSQIFAEISDSSISEHGVHLQLYGYNSLYRQAIQGMLGPLYRPLEWPVRMMLERLMVVFGYLHSDDSSSLTLELSSGRDSLFTVTGLPSSRSKDVAKRVVRRLRGCTRALGGLPLFPQMGPPGYGNHSGGSFPMAGQPSGVESDTLGRVHGLTKVHIVDASVLPTLPSTTITLSAMANAHRIASSW